MPDPGRVAGNLVAFVTLWVDATALTLTGTGHRQRGPLPIGPDRQEQGKIKILSS